MSKRNEVVFVKVEDLKFSATYQSIYGGQSQDTEFKNFCAIIEKYGIKEPLVVDGSMVVISGNRRLDASLNIGLKEVPCLIIESEASELLTVVHNQQRVKSPSAIIREIEVIEKHHGIRQGVRSDLSEEMAQARQECVNLAGGSSRLQKLKQVNTLVKEVYGDENGNEAQQVWKDLDEGKSSLHKAIGTLRFKKRQQAQMNTPRPIIQLHESCRVVHKSCELILEEVAEGSVQTIITSPPYYKVRDYGLGDGELGQEQTVDLFVDNLVSIFDPMKLSLSDHGSLWVNLGDTVVNGQLLSVPHRFRLAMAEKGWILNDEIIWVRPNPRPLANSPRLTRSHEYIFQFVKQSGFYYDATKFHEMKELGLKNSVLSTPPTKYSEARKISAALGHTSVHDSAFPVELPKVLMSLTSRPGDLVVDPFNGIGTTGLAAQAMNRNYLGFELNEEHIEVSRALWTANSETTIQQAA